MVLVLQCRHLGPDFYYLKQSVYIYDFREHFKFFFSLFSYLSKSVNFLPVHFIM